MKKWEISDLVYNQHARRWEATVVVKKTITPRRTLLQWIRWQKPKPYIEEKAETVIQDEFGIQWLWATTGAPLLFVNDFENELIGALDVKVAIENASMRVSVGKPNRFRR